jgi:hypothetical protein
MLYRPEPPPQDLLRRFSTRIVLTCNVVHYVKVHYVKEIVFTGGSQASFRFSETTDCLGRSSHFRNDLGCWNFLYLKFALNFIAALPMQACCN